MGKNETPSPPTPLPLSSAVFQRYADAEEQLATLVLQRIPSGS